MLKSLQPPFTAVAHWQAQHLGIRPSAFDARSSCLSRLGRSETALQRIYGDNDFQDELTDYSRQQLFAVRLCLDLLALEDVLDDALFIDDEGGADGSEIFAAVH